MERRNFIQRSAIGIVGYNLMGAGKNASHLFQTAAVHQWLHQLVSATSAKKRSGLFLPSELELAVVQINKPYSKLGFTGAVSAFYFYGDHEDYCFYPLENNHSSGMTELVMPVLHKEKNGDWNQIATVNGYQLEALAHASIALKDVDIPLQALLLPVVKSNDGKYFQTFATDQGAITIQTRVYADKDPESSIELLAQNEILYSETYGSKHCLTSSNINI